MRHIPVTTKKDQMVLIHVDTLKEAYPAADGQHTVCVLQISDRDKEDTFLIVKESTPQIYNELQKLKYEGVERGE